MKCKECGTGLRRYTDRALIIAFKEYTKLHTKFGLIKAGYRIYNYWRGYLSDNLLEVKGYYYCPKCQTYIIVCPNCGHNIQLGKDYPLQGNKYDCPHCKRDMIYYDKELEDDDFFDSEYE